jgi:hypothetical protein
LTSFTGLSDRPVFPFSIRRATFIPSKTRPNTTCLPLSQLLHNRKSKQQGRYGQSICCHPQTLEGDKPRYGQSPISDTYGVESPVTKKNWEPLVSGPLFAIDSTPGALCANLKPSSLNFLPYIDFPPLPLERSKSPPCSLFVRSADTRCSHMEHRGNSGKLARRTVSMSAMASDCQRIYGFHSVSSTPRT